MTAFDWLAIALIGLSALYGVTRGLVFEVISLLGWGAAFWCAQAFATGVAAWLPIGEAEAAWRYPLAFVLVFVGVAFGVGLAASLMRRLVSAAGLSPVDRTLGGAFGLARGAVVLLVLAVMVHLLALSEGAWWRDSRSAGVLDAALQGLKPSLPEKLASYLP
ncbi:MAG: CvpA family protein [Variovorax sp.]|nr:MAG: CvpA family protein [Variovorax sp.]